MAEQDFMYFIRDIKEATKVGSEYSSVEYEVTVDNTLSERLNMAHFISLFGRSQTKAQVKKENFAYVFAKKHLHMRINRGKGY